MVVVINAVVAVAVFVRLLLLRLLVVLRVTVVVVVALSNNKTMRELLDAITAALDRVDALEAEMRAVAVEFAALALRIDGALDTAETRGGEDDDAYEEELRALLERVTPTTTTDVVVVPGGGGLDATSTA